MEAPMLNEPDRYPDIRDAVRQLCRQFPDAYFRKIDEQRAYPEAFVDALTQAGWMAALIPAAYGGSGLSMAEASVIMEEINRCGGNAGACHGQMYVMNAIVRSGTEAQRQRYLPRIAKGALRIQSMAVTEPSTGSVTTPQDHGGEAARPLGHQRPEGLDVAHPAQRHDDRAGAHHATGRCAEAV
jgi:acyl-CoA dehydrogenase